MVSESISFGTPSYSADFTADQIGRIAGQLRQQLDIDLERIGTNDGHVSGFGWSRRDVFTLTDAEVSSYATGLRSVAMGFAGWLEDSATYQIGLDVYPLRKHAATCDQVDEDIAGALGECLHRRHPDGKPFSGRLRKLNELIARIRLVRITLNDAFLSGRFKEGSDLAYEWLIGEGSKAERLLHKMEFSGKLLFDRDALARTKAELHSLARVCDRVRKAHSDQLLRLVRVGGAR